MTRRIFRSICLVALAVTVASVSLFLFTLYNYFAGIRRNELRTQTELMARGLESEGISYISGFETSDYRITWIDSGGKVIYDNRSESGEMENHLEREEIKSALEKGYGESSRYSSTLTERYLYSAKRLSDGSVIRLSVSQMTVLTLLLGMAQPICVIILIAVAFSLILASRLSKKIVMPLNELDLEDPLGSGNKEYDELSPLLHRLDSQQKQIALQKAELEKKQKEFETVTENMAEGIILMNTDGIILSINRAASLLFRADPSCIGKDLTAVSRSDAVSDLLSQARSGKRAEKILNLRESQYRVMIDPVKDEDTLSGFVMLVIDTTEKERSDKMRREFTANVSHELKTPLQTIAGSSELLVNGVVREEDKMNFYTRIRDESQRMIRLVEDIIHLSHLDEGAEDMKREEIDLLLIAKETADSLSREAQKARVTLSVSGEPAVMSGIPRLLQSIVFNLCDNAIKYNRENGSVTVTVKSEGDSVTLRVADTGIGIPQEHIPRIFERFYRVDKSRSKELGGTGLGLSIVKHAAMLHNAVTDIQSAENTGTTVTVTFPKNGSSG